MLQTKQEELLVEFLALLYNKIQWNKIKTNKNPHDIFNHRVRASARRATLYQFSSKLCNYFGLQSLSFDAQQILDILRPFENQILNALSSEHIPLCIKGIMRAKEIKKNKKEGTNDTQV